MNLFVVLMICSTAQPVCNQSTARAYESFRAPDGFVICGGPPSVAMVNQSALAPGPNEFVRTRCVLK